VWLAAFLQELLEEQTLRQSMLPLVDLLETHLVVWDLRSGQSPFLAHGRQANRISLRRCLLSTAMSITTLMFSSRKLLQLSGLSRDRPVGRSFFRPPAPALLREAALGAGLEAWRGYYQSVRPTQGGLALNLGKLRNASIAHFSASVEANMLYEVLL
jgi:hypothetical protein